ncbi:NAD-dependent epimerase/dehydratase family protein [Rhodohalobacter sp. SW132]|uniref:GDP-mannose 4,6-dehydratase n=1 Tax=Rhodohalobacter sp. SW132 TaxID=2293433 RepID=UPI000E236406|nr:GDP-mannose 4,6-dehydratase [Rhodohalobacter sp. SW132]REL38577.1 NAD-dependent epimerase/dehydratase family protein [Rhodohalobacter sp. SW132]
MNLLITGGAGFIGSNLVEHFLNRDNVNIVRVLDDLSTGSYNNLREFEKNPKFEFVKGSICDYQTCLEACDGIDKISHQAALGSVPRSIENPMRTTEVNVLGTVNILHAAAEKNVSRIVLACSSSTYGDSADLPKVEGNIGKPLSPYAVSKVSVEQYAEVFSKVYGLTFIGLRYFNIFGKKQDPENPYAAVIPIFCKAYLDGVSPTINGDGKTTRDFTHVSNAIQANELALTTEKKEALNEIYNIACGDRVSLMNMVEILEEISGNVVKINYGPERPGDVKHSLADISKARERLDYNPEVFFREGLEKAYQYYKKIYDKQ